MMRMIGAAAAAALAAGCPAYEPMAERTVYFGFDRETLTAEAIDQIVFFEKDAAREGAGAMTLVGHADTVSDEAYNQGLSARRAATVRQDLIARGAPADAITTVPLGESAPALETGDEVIAPENRFVTLQFSDPGVREAPDRDTPYRMALPPNLPVERQPLDARADAAGENAPATM